MNAVQNIIKNKCTIYSLARNSIPKRRTHGDLRPGLTFCGRSQRLLCQSLLHFGSADVIF